MEPTSRRRGRRVNKQSPAFQAALLARQAPLPPFADWTYGEVQLFRNGPDRPRTTTEFVLKLGAVVEPDFAKFRASTRRRMLEERWAPLSPVDLFARNCAPSRAALSDEDRALAEQLKAAARAFNRGRVADDQPAALVGWVGARLHGAGTVRSRGMGALLFWDPGAGVWCPRAVVTHPEAGFEEFALEPPTRPEGRDERACAWFLPVYSPAYRAFLEQKKAAADAWRAGQEEAQARPEASR